MRFARSLMFIATALALLESGFSAGAQSLGAPTGLTVPAEFEIVTIARIPAARELAALPNGDLLVGTESGDVYLVPNAEGTAAGTPHVFGTLPDAHAAGVAYGTNPSTVYIGTEHGVYAAAYTAGQGRAADFTLLARVRTGAVAPNSDGDVHTTTSVAYADNTIYASVGSSCNACTEVDPTRAAILRIPRAGGPPSKRATRIRNAIALAIDPATQALWAGDAGQDNLPSGHPYEFMDDVTSHPGVADYGWPECEENQHAFMPGADCSHTVAPLVVVPAYSTFIGAAFYPIGQTGPHAFPQNYRGAIFATLHGSWHRSGESYAAAPQVVTIAMRGDRPATPVDWANPHAQWRTFVGGFQPSGLVRTGRPTGVAVGTEGSLFIADDARGTIYRVRPR